MNTQFLSIPFNTHNIKVIKSNGRWKSMNNEHALETKLDKNDLHDTEHRETKDV